MVFGYVRVSTKDQNVQMQLDALEAYGCDQIFIEQISAFAVSRPEYEKMIASLRYGYTIVIWRIDRLGRRTLDLVKLMAEFSEMGVNFVSITEGIDTTSQLGKVYFLLASVFAENEATILKERTLAGLESAKAKGRFGGKPPGMSDTALKNAEKAYDLRLKGLTAEEILRACKIKSKRTLYKYIRYHANVLSLKSGMKLAPNGLELLQ